MKILITGVNGFIGVNLANALLSEGHQVIGIGKSLICKVENITKYLCGNILERSIVEEAMVGVEVVIHLAALTDHASIINNRYETLEINFLGTKNVLDSFVNSPSALKFIYSSSGKVYGDAKILPLSENQNVNPSNILGKSKLITENLIDFYASFNNIHLSFSKQYLIFRIFNVYGPGQKENFLIPTILKQLNKSSKIILGDVNAKRDYLFITDIVRAFNLAIKNNIDNNLSIINLCSNVGTSAQDIVNYVSKLTGRDISISVDKTLLRKNENSLEFGNFTKARELLGWEPKISIMSGLQETILSAEKILNNDSIGIKNMNIVVTGGAGFIGSNIVTELVNIGHNVTVIDDFSLGRMDNLKDIKDKIRLVPGSILETTLVNEVTAKVDYIIHLAAASASPMFSLDNLSDAVRINIEGFLNILKAAVKNNVKRVIYASSSSIYGNNKNRLDEQSKELPSNIYAATKLSNEYFANVFGLEYGLETVGFRFLSVYGPNEEGKGKFANLASQFTWAALKNQPVVIYGDGNQRRDFTYVKDVVQAITLAIDCKKSLIGQVFNVASGSSYSLNELTKIIGGVLNNEIKPKYITNPVKNYIACQDADITKIKEVLGYLPKFDLIQGLSDMLSVVKVDSIREN
jgi:nucleoside-diphosphate-sugar epimerase